MDKPNQAGHDPNFILLYVEDPLASAAFYTELLGHPAVETSPTFVMFALDTGVMLGLWSRRGVEPAATGVGGACELAFTVADAAGVERKHREWKSRRLPIIQQPTAMDFGYTFVALDPDGHRLRVFAPRQ